MPIEYEYVPIRDLVPGPSCNFYGVVASFSNPMPTRGTDYIMKITVVDGSGPALLALFFKSDPAIMPQVRSKGEIVQFRHMKVQTFQGDIQAISTHWTAYTVFSRTKSGDWETRPERTIIDNEKLVLERMALLSISSLGEVDSPPRWINSGSRPLITISSIKPNVFFDTVAEILRVSIRSPTQTILLLCDYTDNELVHIDCEELALSPEFKQRVLVTTCWDGFAERAAKLKVGQVVKLLNLRPKVVKGNLVAALHGSDLKAEKIYEIGGNCSETMAITRRKTSQSIMANSGREDDRQSPRRLPKIHDACFDTQDFNVSTVETFSTKILKQDLRYYSLESIIDTPIEGQKIIVTGRVTRYKPVEIFDFVRRQCLYCKRNYHRLNTECSKCQKPLDHWIFLFILEISDGENSIPVVAIGREASRFLDGRQPCDVYQNPEASACIQSVLIRFLASPLKSAFCITGSKDFQYDSGKVFFLTDTVAIE